MSAPKLIDAQGRTFEVRAEPDGYLVLMSGWRGSCVRVRYRPQGTRSWHVVLVVDEQWPPSDETLATVITLHYFTPAWPATERNA